MAKIEQQEAHNYLNNCGIYKDARGFWPDFHALHSEKVGDISEIATAHKYRKPRDANGSRARYFYEYLTRTAK